MLKGIYLVELKTIRRDINSQSPTIWGGAIRTGRAEADPECG